jgi:RNA polymerase sigma-70 factor, ECF subfamily
LQETVLRAYRFFQQYTPGANCRAWLLTILYNNFRNGYRGADREQVSLTPEDFEREVEV